MRAEFNKLVETMQKYDLYQAFDEVDIALIDLHDKITEVEKRIECAIRSNIDSQEVVNLFINGFQDEGKLKQELHYGDFETLKMGVYDVAIALDLKDTEPIDNDWYDLFGEPKEKPEVSNGGIPYQHCAECNIKEEEIVMTKMPNGVHLCCDCKEEPPTDLCKTPQTHEFVKDIIAKLKVIDVDGETMQYILEQVGMTDQMLRQLVMTKNSKKTKKLLREKKELQLC